MDELIGSFGTEDCQRVLSIHETTNALLRTVDQHEVSAKDLIRTLTTRVTELESSALPSESPAAHNARVEHLRQAAAEAEARIQAGHNQAEDHQTRREAVRAHQASLETDARRIQAAQAELGDANRKLALYGHISRGNLDESVWPSRVKGSVTDMSASGPRPFDFDARVSRTEMADQLWKLMDDR